MIASVEAPLPDVQQLNFDGTPLYPQEAPATALPEVVPGVEAPESRSWLVQAAGYAGKLVTQAAVTATDYLKREGLKLAAHATLAGLAVAYSAGVIGRGSNTVEAASGPRYTVAGTAAGGVFSRNTPHTADTPRIVGRGAYPGDVLTLECGVTDGDPVQPYNNHTWYYAHDNSRSEPDFWINDHYMNTPNAANQLAPGVQECANDSSNPMAAMQPVALHTQDTAWGVSTDRFDYHVTFPKSTTDQIAHGLDTIGGTFDEAAYFCGKIPQPQLQLACATAVVIHSHNLNHAVNGAEASNQCLQFNQPLTMLGDPVVNWFGWGPCLPKGNGGGGW